jgi:hypothetical protein
MGGVKKQFKSCIGGRWCGCTGAVDGRERINLWAAEGGEDWVLTCELGKEESKKGWRGGKLEEL